VLISLGGLVAFVGAFGGLYIGWLLLTGTEPPATVTVAVSLLGLVIGALVSICRLEEQPDRSLEQHLLRRWLERQRAERPPQGDDSTDPLG
jgi:hypothetical protein